MRGSLPLRSRRHETTRAQSAQTVSCRLTLTPSMAPITTRETLSAFCYSGGTVPKGSAPDKCNRAPASSTP